VPHEFHAWGNPEGFPDEQQRARTIALCTENPGTEWFEQTRRIAGEFGAAVSINRSSAAEFRRLGVPCEHLQLGYSPLWDSWRRDQTAPRTLDVLYLGAADPRRDPLLAGLGADLWARECELLIPPLEPRTGPRPDFLKEADKYRRLRSAKTLLNLHRTTSAALEWMRFLEAICNGCVVVSEPCLDSEPLVAGEHFVSASADWIGDALNSLLDDPDRLQQMRERAYDFVHGQLSMRPAAEQLVELAAELSRRPPRAQPLGVSAAGAPIEAPAQPEPASERQPIPKSSPPGNSSTHAAGVLRRPLTGIYRRIRYGSSTRTLQQSKAYAHCVPQVSVLSVVSNATVEESVEALTSVAASTALDLELLILDDDPLGQSTSALSSFLDEHPSLPARRLGQSVNRGLAHSLNVLADGARGEHLFILDATGGIYPSTLARLLASLDADPQAIFAYPMVALYEEGRPVELLGSLPWEPERLMRESWIDPMALIRRRRLSELGGYDADPRLAGLEAFDLSRKCAKAGAHGVQVPQVLAWHRRSPHRGAEPSRRRAPAQWELVRGSH
jgi:hypothetical protein